jgi:nitrate reductase NapE component
VSQPAGITSPAPAAAAPAKKGSPLVKIILVVVGIFAFVTVASIGACVYIGYRAKRAVEQTVKMEEGGKSFKIQTPQGEIKLGEHPTKEGETIAGVPIYPGATALEGGGQFSFGDKFQIGGQDYLTSDPVDKVVDFYKEKYGSKLSVAENAGHYRLSLESGDEKHSGVVTIDVFADEESGKTKITIAHMGGMK